MVLDTELESSVKYQSLVVRGHFSPFFGSNLVQIGQKLSKINYAVKEARQDYFSSQFEELSLILHWKKQKLPSKQPFYA